MIFTYLPFPFICLGFCFQFKNERTILGRWQLAALALDHTRNTIVSIISVAYGLLDNCNNSSGGRTECYDEQTTLNHAFIFYLLSHQYLSETCGHFLLYTKGCITESRHFTLNLIKR